MLPDRQLLSVPALASATGTFVSASSRVEGLLHPPGGASFAHSFQGILKDDPVSPAADSNPSPSPQPCKHVLADVFRSMRLLVPAELPVVQAAGLGSPGWGRSRQQ